PGRVAAPRNPSGRPALASSTGVPMSLGERMLIDGELVAAGSGRTFANINPATEEVIGEAPDAGTVDLERAIGAARRAFDTSAWPTDVQLRQRCLRQLRDALSANVEILR